MKKGFTLIELLIVVIVVAILATLALPQYIKAVERAKEGKAKHHMGLIAQAEKMYRADNDLYLVVAQAALNDDPGLGSYVELAEIVNDTDWGYAVASDPVASNFVITATRSAGPNAAELLTLNQDGIWVEGGWSP